LVFTAAKLAVFFDMTNFFSLIFDFLKLLLPFWGDLRAKNANFAS